MHRSNRPSNGSLARLTFGLVPSRDDPETRVMLNDLCARLAQATGLTFAAHRAPSPAALASALGGGRVHFAWVSPTLMVTAEQMAGVVPLLSAVREGVTAYHSVLFAPRASPVRTFEQLRGCRIGWVAPSSAAGYILPRISLVRRGIDVRTAFAREAFFGSHIATARAALAGEVDAAATFAVFERGDARGRMVKAGYFDAGDPRQVRVLDVAGPVPSDLIVASPQVTPGVRAVVARAFEALAGDEVARMFLRELVGTDCFRPFSATVLAELAALVRSGRELGALASGV